MSYSNEYAKSFCKTASDAGVDPVTLVKVAKEKGWLDSIKDTYKSIDPETKRAIIGGLLSGAGTYALSDGSVGDRLLKGLAGGAIGGLGVYGLDRTGLTDKGLSLLQSGLEHLKTPKKKGILSNIGIG